MGHLACRLVQNSADLRPDQPLGQFAKVQVQDGFEGARHVGGGGKEFGQGRIRFQLPSKLFPDVIGRPVAVGVLTGEYCLGVHGPALRSPRALALP
jgi:hypothetical protein